MSNGTKILPGIEHLIVVMLENRSLDNMLGSLYAEGAPALVLPPGSPSSFDGLRPGLTNPANSGYFSGSPAQPVPVSVGATSSTVPDPDPEETFANVSYQIFGPDTPSTEPRWPMQGFVVNYALTGAQEPTQIMQCYDPAQVPVLAGLAREYAVCDAWFAPVPSQTWPNRAFAHAGTSNGHVDNGTPPDPLQWDVKTIFAVLSQMGVSWKVYHDTTLVPSLTRSMFPGLWDVSLDQCFDTFDAFQRDCAAGQLPAYTFVEPSFLIDPNDEHPPHDVNSGEAFLHAVWTAVSSSPTFAQTMLVITFDEHGGCYDHVLPPFGATSPDAGAPPGDQGFRFDRFGVRVPTVVVSPLTPRGTVFRSNTPTPYDHTSILATLRDWLTIPDDLMLPSQRIAAAPTLAQLVSLPTPRVQQPTLSAPTAPIVSTPTTAAPNDLQRSLVSANARRYGLDPATALLKIRTRQHAIDFFRRGNPRSAHPA
jgi:phospholipase C